MLSWPSRIHSPRAAPTSGRYRAGALLAAVSLALGVPAMGCKAKAAAPAEDTEPALDTPMARDLDRICNAEEQSGALDKPPGDRAMHVAIWLATGLESQEARDLSAELSQMPSPTRGKRLKEELVKHGISKCEMLYAWGTP